MREMLSPSQSQVQVSRYHHFIPQFILRNFSHPYNCGKASGKRRRSKNGLYPGDKVVNGIDLSKPEAEVVEMKVAKTLGVQNLYVDVEHPTNQQHIEEMLGKLEGSAAEIILKIRKTFEAGEIQVALKRRERDILRKFLFIMKYRKPSIRKRFSGDTADDYQGPDKEDLINHMRKKGFKKPIEVWLDNIKAMLDIDMKFDSKWETELMEKSYSLDVSEFITHNRVFYLSFCTPSSCEDEFLMTENGYGIHEGPDSTSTNPHTGETSSVFTEFHLFAHISPRLTMILRSTMLPIPEEDANPDIKAERELFLALNSIQHSFGPIQSLLHDLPVTKAHNSYSRILNGRFVPLRGDEVVRGPNDTFFFQFFRLSSAHVSMINSIFLAEAFRISFIIFNDKLAARRAIEHYLCFEYPDCSLKMVENTEDDPRFLYLKKLEGVVRKLGGEAAAKYCTVEETRQSMRMGRFKDKVYELVKNSKETIQIYTQLSKKSALDRKDFDQARIMLRLRIKADTWTRGFDEDWREKVRQDLCKFYCQLPSQRVWLYLKRFRFMLKDGTFLQICNEIQDFELSSEDLSGPEDVIARSAHLFRHGQLNRIMYHATINHSKISNPNFGLQGRLLTQDMDRMLRVQQDIYLAFGPQGSICDCGIPEMEAGCRTLRNKIQSQNVPLFEGPKRLVFRQFLEPEERLELATRLSAKQEILIILKAKALEEMRELIDVLFTFVYPIFGFDGQGLPLF